jgi:hypothetical protein
MRSSPERRKASSPPPVAMRIYDGETAWNPVKQAMKRKNVDHEGIEKRKKW